MMFRRPRRTHADFRDEVQAHLANEMESLEREGMSPEEARAAARRAFGNLLQAEEQFYERHRAMWLDHVVRDVRLAVRTLAKSRGLTAAAMLILTLGTGANTAIFTVLNAILLRTLPARNPEELVLLETRSNQMPVDGLDYGAYRELRDHNEVLAQLAGSASAQVTLGKAGAAETAVSELVSGNYFETLGVMPEAGRLFGPEDDRPGGPPVCVISKRLWNQRFGGDPAVVGRTVRLNSAAMTVVGVAAAGFEGVWPGRATRVWVPLSQARSVTADRTGLGGEFIDPLLVIGRRKTGVSLEQARAALQALYWQTHGRERHLTLAVESGARGPGFLRRQLAGPVTILMGTTVLVLILGCVNLATLLLARGMARRREIAIRLMLGAGRWRLMASLWVESLLVAAVGAAAGLAFSRLLVRGFEVLGPMVGGLPAELDMAVDGRVIGFCLLAGLATAALFGLAPAAAITRLAPSAAFRTDAQGGPGRLVFQKSLVAVQVALSVVLLNGAGLFADSLRTALNLRLGFEPDHLILVRLDPVANGFSTGAARAFYDQALQRVRGLPITRSAALAVTVPGSDAEVGIAVQPEGQPMERGKMPMAAANTVSPDYFRTMHIPLLAGRDFTRADRRKLPQVAAVNRAFAERFWPGENAIGKRLAGWPEGMQIIAVVGDRMDSAARNMQLYLPERDVPFSSLMLHVRVNAGLESAIQSLRAELKGLAPNLPITEVKTMEDQVRETVSIERLLAISSASFGLLALLLAGIGLYGVVSYDVVRRTRELGLRVALGARRVDILRLVAAQSVRLTGLGLLIGLPAAVAGARVAASLVDGLRPYAVTTYAGVLAALGAMSLVSGLAPAWRALSVDPATSLRHD